MAGANVYAITGRADLEPAPVHIDEEFGKRIVQSLRSAFDQALADRSGLDEGILIAERNWEMVTVERTFPWKGSSNVFIPIIPEQVINVVAATKADVFTPGGFFLLIGKDPEGVQKAHDVQRYYNAKLTERQGLGYRTWLQEAEDLVGLSALHGTSYLDITYLHRTRTKKYIAWDDEIDEETGEPVVGKDGQPKRTMNEYVVEFTEFDGVLWEALELREVVLVPARAKGISDALNTGAVVRIMYFTENDLIQMSAPMKDGRKPLMYRDAVNYLLKSSISKGDSEINQDSRGLETLDIGGQVSPSSQAFSDDINGALKSTVYEILRVETRAIDVDDDGLGEHMIYYMHRQPEVLLGAIPFPYHHDQCLTIEMSLMRRYKRAYGFGVPERLRTIQTEYNANFNMGNDQSNLRLAPPRFQEEGVKILGTDDGQWGPNATFIGAKTSVGILDLPDILPSNREIREELQQMAQRISNQTPPAAPRVTKAGVQAQQAKQNAYQNTMSENVRYALSDAFYLTMELDKQYGPQDMKATVMPQGRGGEPQEVTITKDDLMHDYQPLIIGMGGPQDPAQDRNDRMTLHQMFAARPDFAGDPTRLYKLDEFLLESFPMADKQTLIGSPQEAQQRAQAQQQAQQKEQEMKEKMMEAELGGKHADATHKNAQAQQAQQPEQPPMPGPMM